ncbi:hypothetical protein [Kineosporia babensis]|uniref:Uncharacterized protein n=1 Tax=Kineosporia babensis TaxID=499548 RepID=A0A9X1ND48_9ACTN|nr:hypothetical protein [Kineosporia babensis]MCD5313007.1 hypothetical protein [Kineosporia babensis]
MVELEQLLSGHTELTQRLIRHEIRDLLKRAEADNCRFGTASAGCDVTQMAVAPTILELRMSWHPGGEDERSNLVRLYFTEPADIPDCLYAALLASKAPGPMGLEEQNGHARQADYRVHVALGAPGGQPSRSS